MNSYTTKKFEFFFYFPQTGSYSIYPVSVSRNEKVLAKGENLGAIDLKTNRTIKRLESFQDILNNGTTEDILSFMEKKNIRNNKIFQIQQIYWYVQQDERGFCEKCINILRSKGFYDSQIWELGVRKGVKGCFEEYIREARFLYDFRFLDSELLKIDKTQIFEYHPLLSNRVHNFMNQTKSKILNIQFKQTYE